MYQIDPPRPAKEFLPTMYDLPSEDPKEPGLPDQFHIWQPRLLEDTFSPPEYPGDEIFIASDLNLYYDPQRMFGKYETNQSSKSSQRMFGKSKKTPVTVFCQ